MVKRGKPDQAGDGAPRQFAELGQQRDQSLGENRPDTRHRPQAPAQRRPIVMIGDQFGQLGLDSRQDALELGFLTLDGCAQPGDLQMLELVGAVGAPVDQLAPERQVFDQRIQLAAAGWLRCIDHDRHELRDGKRIGPIIPSGQAQGHV